MCEKERVCVRREYERERVREGKMCVSGERT